MENSSKKDSSNITRAVFRVMTGGILSLIAGLVNQMVIAATFGAGAGMDAFLTAVVIPDYLKLVLLSGLSFVFIPAFVREESSGKDEDAWGLVGTFFWITSIVLVVVAVVGSILSARIIALSAPGFGPDKSAMAAKMLSILMFTVPFAGLGSLTVGIQNARNRFFWPAVGGAINSVGNVIVVIVLSRTAGPMALCWALVVATLSQSAITIIPVLAHGWKKVLPLSDSRVREMGKLVAPLMFFGLLISFTPVAERYFSSGLPNGQISYIGYARKISTIFVSLMASGIASAIFPSMARSFNKDGAPGLAEKNNYGLRLSFSVALPAIVITSAIAVPVVSLLFQRGAFHSVDTLGVSKIVFAVLVSDVLCRMVGNIFTRTCYVLKDTLTPPIIGSVTAVFYIVSGGFFVTRWGYIGLVWARALQELLYILLLWILVLVKLPKTYVMITLKQIFGYLVAASGAYLCSWFLVKELNTIPMLFQLAAGGLFGASLYMLVLYFWDREILVSILEMFGVQRILVQLQGRKVQPEQKPF